MVPVLMTSPSNNTVLFTSTVPEFVVVPLKSRNQLEISCPAFDTAPFTISQPPAVEVRIESDAASVRERIVVVAVTFVLVDAGIVTSSVEIGTWPQDQFAAVLKSLVPALANVQLAACAVCGKARRTEKPTATKPAKSQVGRVRIREAANEMVADTSWDISEILIVDAIYGSIQIVDMNRYKSIHKQNPAFEAGFIAWLGDLDSNQDTMLQRH